MPDFFDRLIARGTGRPSGEAPSAGLPAHHGYRAAGPGSAAAFTLALPRLPGPFERPAVGPPGTSLETADEVREVDAVPSGTARARRPLGSLAGTHVGIVRPPFPRGSTSSPRPGSTRAPGGQPPQATPVRAAGAAAPDQPPGRGSRPGYPTPALPAPRPLAVPASAVRAAWPAADDAPGATALQPATPPVVVRIGRIEVRNARPERRERPAQRRARRAAPKLTLADYLAAANGGRNGSGATAGGGR